MKNFLAEDGKRTDGTSEEQKITVREGKGKSAFTQTFVANDGSRSRLGAKEVYQSEVKAAEDTIQRQDIPAGYREYLRKYFERIQPDAEESSEGDGK